MILFPTVRAILTVPFWLPAAPRPLSAVRREDVLKRTAAELNRNVDKAASALKWEAVELDWSREPYSIDESKIWHPKAAKSRKGMILRGTFIETEQPPTIDLLSDFTIAIVERSIIYFDYDVCSLEY